MRLRLWLVVLLLWGGPALTGPAAATTFILASPEQLLEASEAAVVGQVVSLTAVDNHGDVRTNIELSVEQSLKARYDSAEIVVVESGGDIGGSRRWLVGAPRFWVGERVLLFVHRDASGQLHTTYLAMGKFTISQDEAGNDVAIRDLAEVGTMSPSGTLSRGPQVTMYRLSDLLQQLRARATLHEGDDAIAAPQVVASGSRWQSQFTFSGPPALRWFGPDVADPPTYAIDAAGDATLGTAASIAAAEAALAVWGSPECTGLRLQRGGTAESAPFGACDGRSQILFNDPFDEIQDPMNCVGVLAIGGVCADSGNPQQFNGGTFYRITEGDVVVNNGFEGCGFWNIGNISEVITHELGHSIGLAHSSDDPNESDPILRDATMYYAAHFDGRGASLHADDQAAVCSLYPSGLSGSLHLRQFALVFDTASRPQSDRLVVDGLLQLTDQQFIHSRDTLILSAQVAGTSLLRLAVPPGHWQVSRLGTRLRYRDVRTSGRTTLTLSVLGPGSFMVHLRATGLDLSMARTQDVSLSVAMGSASVSKAVALRNGSRSRVFP
ncbi:MAG: matrixin family metalloprotease [Deltaproteobacteria bacterium]|nr:matrixin family metalloprotease [Deltaproteobacteria bacterium]